MNNLSRPILCDASLTYRLIISRSILLLLLFIHQTVSIGQNTAQTIPEEYAIKGISTTTSKDQVLTNCQLFLATYAVPDQRTIGFVEMKLKHTFNALIAANLSKKKTDKQVELISQSLQENFFKIYLKNAHFEQLFREGAYDEYSFVALWSLVLTHFDIPYQIYQAANDVHLMVGEVPTQVKVNPPQQQQALPPVSYLHEYANLLKETGLISASEFSMKSSESLYQEYFQYGTKAINTSQLAGLMCYNQAGQQYMQKDYAKVLKTLEAAKVLCQMPRYDALRYASLMQLANGVQAFDEKDLAPLFDFYHQHPIPEIKTEIVKRFLRISKILLEKEETEEKQLHLYANFLDQTSGDIGLQEQLMEIHYLQMAKYFAQSYQTIGVLTYMDSLYAKRPSDKSIQEILAVLLVRSLGNDRDFKNGLEVLKIYRKKYPFLSNMSLFNDLELFYQAEQAHYYFSKSETSQAIDALLQFERSLVRLGQTPRVKIWLRTVYTSAADYFIRQGDNSEALRMIQRGLSLDPQSPYFQHRYDLLR
ncbi:MAG: hypothetical protein R2828_05665 [Saprospiraceae bacterium]